jgi:hypothetical protein
MLSRLRHYIDGQDCLLVAGGACVFAGVDMVYTPAAWILLGLGLLFLACRSEG